MQLRFVQTPEAEGVERNKQMFLDKLCFPKQERLPFRNAVAETASAENGKG
jgi:hypothetical protein